MGAAHISHSAMTTPLAMHFYHLHALPASRPLPSSQIVLETLGGDGSQSRPLVPSQKEIGVAGPGYSKGGSVTSGVERRKAASRAYIPMWKSSRSALLPPLHRLRTSIIPNICIEIHPSSTDIRRFSRATVRSTSTVQCTPYLTVDGLPADSLYRITSRSSPEHSGAAFGHHNDIVFRDSVHRVELYSDEGGEHAFDDCGA
jgi:hypothetical protein